MLMCGFPPGNSRLFIPSLGCYISCMRLPQAGMVRAGRELPAGLGVAGQGRNVPPGMLQNPIWEVGLSRS
jgi:hypothetical protein